MSLEFAKTFNFLHRNTILHRIDPRAKSFMVIIFAVLAFLLQDLSLQIYLFLLTLPLLYFAQITTQFLKGLKGLTFIFFFILVINTLILSLNFSLIIIFRMTTLLMVFSCFFQTTLPEDITQSLIQIGVPYPIAYALSLSFRFIPTMALETEIITEAQLSRGHKIDQGGISDQVKNLFPLLVPLLMNSIRRAYHVAEALETRAFGINSHPTYFHPLKFSKRDYIFILLQIIFLAAGITAKHFAMNLPIFLIWNLTL